MHHRLAVIVAIINVHRGWTNNRNYFSAYGPGPAAIQPWERARIARHMSRKGV